MLGHNVFIWNVRGLNSRARRDVVRKFLAHERVSVVCLEGKEQEDLSDFQPVRETVSYRGLFTAD